MVYSKYRIVYFVCFNEKSCDIATNYFRGNRTFNLSPVGFSVNWAVHSVSKERMKL